MSLPNIALAQKINEARTASFGGEVTLRHSSVLPVYVEEITFVDGEIEQVIFEGGVSLKRGMLVGISSRYTGTGAAVIIGFTFGGTQHPIVISRGGSEGEMRACVHIGEITLLPKQTGKGDVSWFMQYKVQRSEEVAPNH